MSNIDILTTHEYGAMTDTELFLKKFQKELAAGTVSLVLLTVLLRANQPLYGYQIAKQLDGSSEGVIAGKQSALYPVLRNLEAAGLAESDIEPSISGPETVLMVLSGFSKNVKGKTVDLSKTYTTEFVKNVK